MSDKLTDYQRADAPLPGRNRLWPLYGAGLDHLGREGQPIEVPMPQYGPGELLVRHDACGLCFSDIKIIRLGNEHPRIYREMRADPVVLGHEVAMTVVGVGENLRDQYRAGDRFVIQADVFVDGVGYAYGYEIQGGLSYYGVIDQRVLNGDHGNYLLPVRSDTGYAESALTEPWACVIAAYQLTYRTGLKPGGTTWIIGTREASERRVRSLEEAGAVVLGVAASQGQVSIRALLRLLGRRQVMSLLLEGGPTLAGSFWKTRLLDRLVLFFAPKVLGDPDALPLLRGGAVPRLQGATGLGDVRVRRLAQDLMVTGKMIW